MVTSRVTLRPVASPLAGDAAVGAVVAGIDRGDVAYLRRLDDDVFESRFCRVRADAGESLIEPIVRRGETRVDLRPVAVPLFPERGGTLLDHVTPAGIVFFLIDAENEIVTTDVIEEFHQQHRSQHAGVEMAFVFLHDAAHEVFQHRRALRGGGEADHQRKGVVNLLVDDVAIVGGVEIGGVGGIADGRGAQAGVLRLAGATEGGGHFPDNLPEVDAVAVAEEFGHLRTWPVARVHATTGRHPIADERKPAAPVAQDVIG